MRVLIVDDHEVIWSGMRGVVERLASQQRPGEEFRWYCARDVPAVRVLDATELDLILLDFHLPGITGLEALIAVRELFEAVPVVVTSGDQRPQNIRGAIEAGAAGYIPKTMPEQEMVAALSLVMARGIYLPPVALLEEDDCLGGGDVRVAADALPGFVAGELSPRQREVFARALRGKPNKLIARELGIAEGTVKIHLAMVFRALGVRNRTEALYRVLSTDAAEALDRL